MRIKFWLLGKSSGAVGLTTLWTEAHDSVLRCNCRSGGVEQLKSRSGHTSRLCCMLVDCWWSYS